MVFCRVSRSGDGSMRTNDEGGAVGIVASDYALDGVVRKWEWEWLGEREVLARSCRMWWI